jgi:hypothetical protein
LYLALVHTPLKASNLFLKTFASLSLTQMMTMLSLPMMFLGVLNISLVELEAILGLLLCDIKQTLFRALSSNTIMGNSKTFYNLGIFNSIPQLLQKNRFDVY